MAAADQEPHDPPVRPCSYQDESYLHGFLGAVGDLQEAGVLQDVVLEVEDRRFPCHRLVLSAASPYFRAMFTNDMAESRQKTVVLQGLDAGMFGELLSYIYSGTLHVSLDKVQPLYQAADLLQLDYVRDTCSSYMAMNVEHSTCVDLYKFADTFSVEIARKHCLQWIFKHFAEVASSEEFCSLSVNQLTEIIGQDELDVKEETTVWEAVVRWVQHSREDRLHHLPSILPHIRFNLLTSDDTAAILEHPMVREDPRSSEVIRNVVQKGNSDLKPRLGMTTEMVLLYIVGSKELLFMNPREGKYISCSYDAGDLPEAQAMAVTSNNSIYMLATEIFGSDELPLFRYNHVENVWEPASMSPVPVSEPGDDWHCVQELLIQIDGILYYLDICSLDIVLVVVRRYDRHTDQWQQCSRLQLDTTPETVWSLSSFNVALSCGSNLYFFTNTEMHRYDPSQDRWCRRTPPMISTYICTAVAMGTEIFCTDRDFSQTTVYDTESDSWQKLQGLPNPGNLAVGMDDITSFFVLENQLHILLEAYDTAIEESPSEYFVYVFDRSADAWRDLKVNLPDKSYTALAHTPLCPVARIYLPYLTGALKHY
ncbi:kelch repeat and BTB domain-containing protein 8-like [Branchiostoma lanceolatum]|uniref:kelch repeat and BTB domain-containing protein 8-like n=1 Tax=Branchiostoma lanceolatum TaxID=7740 RepID=UPI00345684FF